MLKWIDRSIPILAAIAVSMVLAAFLKVVPDEPRKAGGVHCWHSRSAS